MLAFLSKNNDEAQNAVSDVQYALQLRREIGLRLEMEEYIISLGLVVYLVSELSLSPLFNVGKRAVRLDKVSKLGGKSVYLLLVFFQRKNNDCLVLFC